MGREQRDHRVLVVDRAIDHELGPGMIDKTKQDRSDVIGVCEPDRVQFRCGEPAKDALGRTMQKRSENEFCQTN